MNPWNPESEPRPQLSGSEPLRGLPKTRISAAVTEDTEDSLALEWAALSEELLTLKRAGRANWWRKEEPLEVLLARYMSGGSDDEEEDWILNGLVNVPALERSLTLLRRRWKFPESTEVASLRALTQDEASGLQSRLARELFPSEGNSEDADDDLSLEGIDEMLVARFLGGDCTDEERLAVQRVIAGNPRVREWVELAQEFHLRGETGSVPDRCVTPAALEIPEDRPAASIAPASVKHDGGTSRSGRASAFLPWLTALSVAAVSLLANWQSRQDVRDAADAAARAQAALQNAGLKQDELLKEVRKASQDYYSELMAVLPAPSGNPADVQGGGRSPAGTAVETAAVPATVASETAPTEPGERRPGDNPLELKLEPVPDDALIAARRDPVPPLLRAPEGLSASPGSDPVGQSEGSNQPQSTAVNYDPMPTKSGSAADLTGNPTEHVAARPVAPFSHVAPVPAAGRLPGRDVAALSGSTSGKSPVISTKETRWESQLCFSRSTCPAPAPDGGQGQDSSGCQLCLAGSDDIESLTQTSVRGWNGGEFSDGRPRSLAFHFWKNSCVPGAGAYGVPVSQSMTESTLFREVSVTSETPGMCGWTIVESTRTVSGITVRLLHSEEVDQFPTPARNTIIMNIRESLPDLGRAVINEVVQLHGDSFRHPDAGVIGALQRLLGGEFLVRNYRETGAVWSGQTLERVADEDIRKALRFDNTFAKWCALYAISARRLQNASSDNSDTSNDKLISQDGLHPEAMSPLELELLPDIVELAYTTDSPAGLAAVYLLGEFGNAANRPVTVDNQTVTATDALLNRFPQAKTPLERRWICFALGRMHAPSPEIISTLLKAAEVGDPDVAPAALFALCEILQRHPSSESAEIVRQTARRLTTVPIPAVQRWAAYALVVLAETDSTSSSGAGRVEGAGKVEE